MLLTIMLVNSRASILVHCTYRVVVRGLDDRCEWEGAQTRVAHVVRVARSGVGIAPLSVELVSLCRIAIIKLNGGFEQIDMLRVSL